MRATVTESIVCFSIVCGLAAGSAKAVAADDEVLSEVVVTGQYEFLSADTSGTTNLPIPIEKVPQSIALISEDFIKAANLRTLGDIAQYTAGAVDSGPRGGFSTVVKLRGVIPLRSIDGINVGVAGPPAFEPDYAIYDRVEIVKGPSSVVYGVSSAGGLVNYVTKSATPRTVDYLSAQLGMWNSYRLEGQAAGSLDSADRTRVIGVAVYDQGDSFVDGLSHENTTIYGGIDADLGSTMTGYLHAGYLRQERVASDGVPTFPDGTYPPLPRSFLVGTSRDSLTTPVYHATAGLTWHVTDMLDVALKGNFQRSRMSGDDPYSYDLQPDGDLSVNRVRIFRNTRDTGVGLSSIYKLEGVGLKNSFLSVAATHQRSFWWWHYDSYLFPDGSALAIGNIFDGDDALTRLFESATTPGPVALDTTQRVNTTTISAQAVVSKGPVTVLLGASHSSPKVTSSPFGVDQDFTPPGQMSYRAGLTYELLPGTNAYVSYSESFIPQMNLDINNSVLPPLLGEQYEAGVKYRVPNGRLLLTGSVFQITQKNQAQFDALIGPSPRYKAVGEVENKGVELEALGQITPEWQINAGFAYLDPTITKNSDPTTLGRTSSFVVRQTASVFSTYTIGSGPLQGLTIGGGARYIGPQRTSLDASTRDIPGFSVIDATLGYAVNDWVLQLNAQNILDERYFFNNYDTLSYGNALGTPMNVALTVRRDF